MLQKNVSSTPESVRLGVSTSGVSKLSEKHVDYRLLECDTPDCGGLPSKLNIIFNLFHSCLVRYHG